MLLPIKTRIDVPDFLSEKLPADTFRTLELAIDNLKLWTEKLPHQSLFYLNNKVVIHGKGRLPSGVKYLNVVTADVLMDMHSLYAGQCLAKSWRVAQLVEGLIIALSAWNITVAAGISRSLVETACCWLVESQEISLEWQKSKRTVVGAPEHAMSVRHSLFKASIQVAWGTRLPQFAKRSKVFRRTNVLTLIDKAAKQANLPKLKEQYEVLCDAVHPSHGSSECFWGELGRSEELEQSRIILDRDALGWLGSMHEPVRAGSELPSVILACSEWAVNSLSTTLPAFDRTCRDLCLTAKVYLLEGLNYWGIVKPAGLYDLCVCNSGKKTKFCCHDFGVVD